MGGALLVVFDRKARRKPLALAIGSSRDRCENAVVRRSPAAVKFRHNRNVVKPVTTVWCGASNTGAPFSRTASPPASKNLSTSAATIIELEVMPDHVHLLD